MKIRSVYLEPVLVWLSAAIQSEAANPHSTTACPHHYQQTPEAPASFFFTLHDGEMFAFYLQSARDRRLTGLQRQKHMEALVGER